MIRLDLPAFEDFCGHVLIPSKDQGLVPFRWWGTQRYEAEQIAAGLEAGVHDFIILKGGRQIGGTTLSDALTLWWPQANEGTQGMLVGDEDDNVEYRRDLLLEMLTSLPREYRHQTPVNNRGILRWTNGSRLSFKAAGIKSRSQLGRSRGVNFLHADEVGAWRDLRAASSLRNALSKDNPHRLYIWNSTAQGQNTPFHDMWRTAERVPTQRAVFIAWWRHAAYALIKPGKDASRLDKQKWATYATPPPTEDELAWMRAVKKRYGVTISQGQLGWYRLTLDADQHGDETLMAQEYGCLPEECFQAFGDKFIAPALIRRLRLDLAEQPKPEGFTYRWAATLDAVTVHPCEPEQAELLVWQQPDPTGVYVVSMHPAFSSSPSATDFIAQVWRAWPDQMEQVAEYRAHEGALYQFAWVGLHLAGAYRAQVPCYLILEVTATGYRVLKEMQLLERYGYGLSRRGQGQLRDVIGSIRHYYYYRPDNLFARSAPIDWKTHANNRPWLLNGLRDTIERRHMTIRSAELIDELSAIRRGEEGDNDQIEGGGGSSDSRVMCAALAVECWVSSAMPDLEVLLAPRTPARMDAKSVEQRMVQSYLANVMTKGRT